MRNRRQYPKDWKAMARACKDAADWMCQECGVLQGTKRRSPWTLREWPVYLQAAHKNHDPANESPELIAVCPRCHWRFYRKPGQAATWMIEKIKHQKLIQIAYCQ
jgi:hypothetical protein